MHFKDKFKNIANILFIFIIIIALLTGLLRTVFFPKDINYYENRYSNKIIEITPSTLLDSSFQNSVEDALADQIPKAQTLKKFYNTTTTNFISGLLEPIIRNNTDIYINYLGLDLFGGSIVYKSSSLDKFKPFLDIRIEEYNKLIKDNPEIDFYLYYIEKDTDINFETSETLDASDYLISNVNIPADNCSAFEINDFSTFSEYFYRTDHHWNNKGSYKGYLELFTMLECIGTPIECGEEILVANNFSGSKAATVGNSMFREEFYAYKYDLPDVKIIQNGVEIENYGQEDQYFAGTNDKDVSYGFFYGDDSGEIIFDSGKENLDNILVIGESYDNAILDLLSAHFNKTHSIDLRNYAYSFGSDFNFSQYVELNDIDKVLFIGNIDFYILDSFSLEG